MNTKKVYLLSISKNSLSNGGIKNQKYTVLISRKCLGRVSQIENNMFTRGPNICLKSTTSGQGVGQDMSGSSLFKNQDYRNYFWNQCFDKGRLKSFILWFFINNGYSKAIKLVEELKTLGFEYATKAGISLGIEDLKIPPKKVSLIFDAEKETSNTVKQYIRADITGVERFQRLIDTWHRTSEQLKQEVIDHFETTDILNPVYMMAFSGARGNVSQVRQLVGMRGLMSDPQGQIIDFPIRSNFREGLTLTEYIISSYGARKGIVDTALRTANAGYLTRRLVDVAQHVIISSYDCGTHRGIFLSDMKEGNKTILSLQTRLVGRVLSQNLSIKKQKIASRNDEISIDLAFTITKNSIKKVFVRSPLTCETKKLICQLCYGWSLAQGNLVSIGEAVGVIAGQSIGEPGTQLTMRTFHTGGVFAGDISDLIRMPFTGMIKFNAPILGTLIRTPEGKIAFLTKGEGVFNVFKVIGNTASSLQENTKFLGDSDKGYQIDLTQTKRYRIPAYTLMFARNGEVVSEKEIIAQISSINRQKNTTDDALLTIKSELEGELQFELLDLKETKVGPKLSKQDQDQDRLITNDLIFSAWNWGYAWILSGKIYELSSPSIYFPQLGDYLNSKSYINSNSLAYITTMSGVLQLDSVTKPLSKYLLPIAYPHPAPKALLMPTSLIAHLPLRYKDDAKLQSFKPQNTPILKNVFLSFDIDKIYYKKFGYFVKLLNTLPISSFYKVGLLSTNDFLFGTQLNEVGHNSNVITTSKKTNTVLCYKWYPSLYQTKKPGVMALEKINRVSTPNMYTPLMPSLSALIEAESLGKGSKLISSLNTLQMYDSIKKGLKSSPKYKFNKSILLCNSLVKGSQKTNTSYTSFDQKLSSFSPASLGKFLKKINTSRNSKSLGRDPQRILIPIPFGDNPSPFLPHSPSFSPSSPIPTPPSPLGIGEGEGGVRGIEGGDLGRGKQELDKNLIKGQRALLVPYRSSRAMSFVEKVTKSQTIKNIVKNYKIAFMYKNFYTTNKEIKSSTFWAHPSSLTDSNLEYKNINKFLDHGGTPFSRIFWIPREFLYFKNKFIAPSSSKRLAMPRTLISTSLVHNLLSRETPFQRKGVSRGAASSPERLPFGDRGEGGCFFPLPQRGWGRGGDKMKADGQVALTHERNGVYLSTQFINAEKTSKFLKQTNRQGKEKNLCLDTFMVIPPQSKNRITYLTPKGGALISWANPAVEKQGQRIKENAPKPTLANLNTTYFSFTYKPYNVHFIKNKHSLNILKSLKKQKNIDSNLITTPAKGNDHMKQLFLKEKANLIKTFNRSLVKVNIVKTFCYLSHKTKNFMKKKPSQGTGREHLSPLQKAKSNFKFINAIHFKKGWVYYSPVNSLLILRDKASPIKGQGALIGLNPIQSPKTDNVSNHFKNKLFFPGMAINSELKFDNHIVKVENISTSLSPTFMKLESEFSIEKWATRDSNVFSKLKTFYPFSLLKGWLVNQNCRYQVKLKPNSIPFYSNDSSLKAIHKIYKNQQDGLFLLIEKVEEYSVNTLQPKNILNLKNELYNYMPALGRGQNRMLLSLIYNKNINKNLSIQNQNYLPKGLDQKLIFKKRQVISQKKLEEAASSPFPIPFPFGDGEGNGMGKGLRDTRWGKAKVNLTSPVGYRLNLKLCLLKVLNQSKNLFTLSKLNSLNLFMAKGHNKLINSVYYLTIFTQNPYQKLMCNLPSAFLFLQKFKNILFNQQKPQNKFVCKKKPCIDLNLHLDFSYSYYSQASIINKNPLSPKKGLLSSVINSVPKSVADEERSEDGVYLKGYTFQNILKEQATNIFPFVTFNSPVNFLTFSISYTNPYLTTSTSFTNSLMAQQATDKVNLYYINTPLVNLFKISNSGKQILNNLFKSNTLINDSKMSKQFMNALNFYSIANNIFNGPQLSSSLIHSLNGLSTNRPFEKQNHLESKQKFYVYDQNIVSTSNFAQNFEYSAFEGELIKITSPFNNIISSPSDSDRLFSNISNHELQKMKINTMTRQVETTQVSQTRLRENSLGGQNLSTKQSSFAQLIENEPTFLQIKQHTSLILTKTDLISFYLSSTLKNGNMSAIQGYNLVKNVSEVKKWSIEERYPVLSPSLKGIESLAAPIPFKEGDRDRDREGGGIVITQSLAGIQKDMTMYNTKFESYSIKDILIKYKKATDVLLDENQELSRDTDSSISTSVYKIPTLPGGIPQQTSKMKLGEFLVVGDSLKNSMIQENSVSTKLKKLAVTKSGQIIHLNMEKITLRKGQSIFISPKAILHKYDGDFVSAKASVITLSYQRLKTGDIVQGIPKIEQFFEARTTKRGRLFRDSLPNLLKALFKNYLQKLPLDKAVRQSFYKIQQIIVDGVLRVYRSQGVTISDKHLEIIVKQMTSKVRILEGGQTGFFPGEVANLEFVEQVNKLLINPVKYEPIVLGITKSSLEVDSFLSAASFQQTTRVLSGAAIARKKDFLKGLKENVILGNLIPTGTGYLVYLDTQKSK
jgi:hypothetical protein